MLAAGAGLIVAMLHGCSLLLDNGGSTQIPETCAGGGPVVFAVSGREGSPAPGVTGLMQTAVLKAAYDGAPIEIVNVDGRPKLAFIKNLNPVGSTSYQRKALIHSITSTVAGIRATSPGADPLDALEVASEAVRATCDHGGTVYLEDSGLQDMAPLNFRSPGLLDANPASIVRFLSRNHELPNLKGMTVVLVGIGDTAPPQHPLDTQQQGSLRKIWSAIATAAGARLVQVDPTPRSGSAPSHVPPALLVPIPREPQWPGQARSGVRP